MPDHTGGATGRSHANCFTATWPASLFGRHRAAPIAGVEGDTMPTTSALVIGGSLAGMCAARALSDFVDRVTIIERDAYPSAHDFRPGVPQARHVHNLLARGLRELESFFPGF